MDALAAAAGVGPEQPIEQMGHRQFAPAQGREQGRGPGAEQGAAQRTDGEAGVVQPLGEELEEHPQTVLEVPAGGGALVEDAANDAGQGGAGRVGVPPEWRGGEAEDAGGIAGGLALEDEEQPVDDDQALVPEGLGEGGLVGMAGQGGVGGGSGGVVGMIEDRLHELLDGPAGLDAQLLGDLVLLEAGVLDDLRQRLDARRRGQGQQEQVAFGQVA